jgi:photosystem II stability/assembly factor-like uncharacterized protein
MLKQPVLLVGLLLFSCYPLRAQQINVLTSGKPFSLRGLSVVSDRILWVSGSAGSVGLSTNGGIDWKWIQVPGYEKSDFRDIEAFSDLEAVIMGITEPAVILRTTDGGTNWSTVFRDSSKSAFLDAMDFSGDQAALIGDPDSGKILMAVSDDRGQTWKKQIPSGFETLVPGETFFAASGSNICRIPDGSLVFVSGGKQSCLYIGKNRFTLFMNQGKETTGANSIAVNPLHSNEAFVVGGDFSHDTARYRNALRIQFNPFIQTQPLMAPGGYRSCVEYLDEQRMICCGTSGVDFSEDGGNKWKLISVIGFHTCRKSKKGYAVFLAGPKGSIASLKF